MFKQVTVALLVVALCAYGALAVDQACIDETISYLKGFELTTGVWKLLNALDEDSLEKEMSQELVDKLVDIGPQPGCAEVFEHVRGAGIHVPCFHASHDDFPLISDLAKKDADVNLLMQAALACSTAMVSPFQ